MMAKVNSDLITHRMDSAGAGFLRPNMGGHPYSGIFTTGLNGSPLLTGSLPVSFIRDK